jgi:hypothetical protein
MKLSAMSKTNITQWRKYRGGGERRGWGGENLKISGEKWKFAGEKKTIHERVNG